MNKIFIKLILYQTVSESSIKKKLCSQLLAVVGAGAGPESYLLVKGGEQ
jgi:hypothetical protein